MRLIDGRAIADAILAETTAQASNLRRSGVVPTLAVVIPNRDEATASYVRSIQRAAAKTSIDCAAEQLDGTFTPATLAARLDALSVDPAVHGIICQTPLPDGMQLAHAGAHIDPDKDVDGANPLSCGHLTTGLPSWAPATSAAALEILHHEQVPLAGTRAVIVGRSNVVGKPAALLLLAEHATVTICHSRTPDLATITREADILVSAAGRTHMIGAHHVKPGAIVIDVGTNPTDDGGLAGDVDAEAIADLAAALTPVPGGVGPVTTAILLRNTTEAAHRTLGEHHG